MSDFLGGGMWLGYPNPGGQKGLRYCERLVWAGMFHIHDQFKAHELATLINERQTDTLNVTHVGHALSKFREWGHVTRVRPRHQSSVYSFTQYFKNVRSDHCG